MFQGEIFAYPLYIQRELFNDFGSLEFFCQDVICRYWPWLQRLVKKFPDRDDLAKLLLSKPFLSVMHAKSHDWACQVIII
jgi:hypothetical protein